MASFPARLRAKVGQQLRSEGVAFLLGAGCSYLNSKGYPLASQLWPLIRDEIKPALAEEIQRKLDLGAAGIEEALDLLDEGKPDDFPHRHVVARAIAAHFAKIPPISTRIEISYALYPAVMTGFRISFLLTMTLWSNSQRMRRECVYLTVSAEQNVLISILRHFIRW